MIRPDVEQRQVDRHLRLAPRTEDVLREEITQLGAMVDRRLGRLPGATERGLYFWFWPPSEHTPSDVLAALHRDAVALLHQLLERTDDK